MRQDVAETAEELLAQGANGWFDLLAGKKDNITEAVEKAIASKESAIDGEDKAKMKESAENAFTGEDWEKYCEKVNANQPQPKK